MDADLIAAEVAEARRSGSWPDRGDYDVLVRRIALERVPELLAGVAALRADRDALLDAIETDAARRAYEAGLGASEWEAFVSKATWAVLARVRARQEDPNTAGGTASGGARSNPGEDGQP